nr:hypothetical protein [Streptomyces cyaneus]
MFSGHLQHVVGDVEVADLVLLRRDTPSMSPVISPVGHLVVQATRDHLHSAVGDKAWRNLIDPPRA